MGKHGILCLLTGRSLTGCSRVRRHRYNPVGLPYIKRCTMRNKFRLLVLATATSLGMATASLAATVTYTNADATPKTQLTVDDAAAAGALRFTLTTLLGTADYLGLGFNYSGLLTQSALSLVSATRLDGTAITPALQLYGDGTSKVSTCGNGCNFNGAGSAQDFDYIVRIGSNGGGLNNYVASVVFDITTMASLADLTQFAFRAQSTSNPEGSIKADLIPDTAPIPLPAGITLLGTGLVAMGVMRRKKRQNR